jgi:hypothetical protein
VIISPDHWWTGDRLKARVFLEVRQLIFDLKNQAYAAAPRRKTDITYEVAEAVIGAAAVAIGWREEPGEWKLAADELRRLADEMEASGFRQASWGPNPTFDPTPVCYRADVREDDGYVLLTFPDLPELDVAAAPGEDLDSMARVALEEAVRARLVDGEDAPHSGPAGEGQVDVAIGPELGGKVLRYWSSPASESFVKSAR